jgi:hypothetical protein
MQWFKHDTNSTMDYKIKKLIIRYGAIGYAIYFHCLELIAESISETNITFELEHDSEIIADDLRIQGTQEKSGKEIVEEIMNFMVQLDLFEENNGHIFCFKLLKRLDSSMTSNPRLRGIINEAKTKKNNSHDTVMMNHDTVMTNPDSIMLEEKRREEIRGDEKREEEPSSPPPFMSFPQENYSQQVFEKFRNAKLPCCNGDLFTFQGRDFRNALYKLKGYKSQEVLQAVDNYIFELRNPESYRLKEMTFDNFVSSKTFINCLPSNYRHDNFKSFQKPNNQNQPTTEERHFYEICTKCGQNTMEWSNKKQRYVCYACGCELTFEEVDYARHPEQLSN